MRRLEACKKVALTFPGGPAGFLLFDLQRLYCQFWHVMNRINTVHDPHKGDYVLHIDTCGEVAVMQHHLVLAPAFGSIVERDIHPHLNITLGRRGNVPYLSAKVDGLAFVLISVA